MTVSVVIPSYNGAHRIHRTLDALVDQTHLPEEVIVVIDGSTDDTKVSLERRQDPYQLKVLEQSNQGRAATRNTGVEQARGELLIFLDDDMKPERNFVQGHLKHHITQSASVLVGSQLENLDEMNTDIQRYKAHLSRKWMAEIRTDKSGRIEEPFITAANCSMTKSTFEKLGRFDKKLTDAEDRDLSIRCAQMGIPIFFDAKVLAWHLDLITAASYANRMKEYALATDVLKRKHPAFFSKRPTTVNNSVIYVLASFNIWQWIIDKVNVFLLLPKKVRYKLYDVIFTSVFKRAI